MNRCGYDVTNQFYSLKISLSIKFFTPLKLMGSFVHFDDEKLRSQVNYFLKNINYLM